MRPSRIATVLIAIGLTASTTACGAAKGGQTDAKATDAKIASFTFGVEAIPTTLDVANNYNSADMAVMGLVTQPLEVANLDGTYTPVLAKQVTQPDPLTLVYDLREDVTFSDGSPMTSADVVWTIAHLRGETTQTVSELVDFKSVTATTAHQVTIKLNEPNPAMRGSFDIISFVHQKAYGEKHPKDLGTSAAPPIGTGPYAVDSFNSSKITLKRNPKFEGTKPAVDAFTISPISDDNAGQLAMRSKELDGVAVIDPKTTDRWKQVPGVTTYVTPTLYLDYLTMNAAKKPFDDIHVRRAVAYATDVDGLLKANYGGYATPAVGLTPPEVVDNVVPAADALTQAADAAPQYPFSIEKAKAELAQSAYPQGFTAEYPYYSPSAKLAGLSLAANLKKIGVTLDLKSVKINDYIGDLFVGKVPDIGFFSISAVVPDPSSWYIYLVGKDNPYNAARYSTPETVAALNAIQTGDKAERWAGSKTLVEKMATDVPYVGLAQPDFVFALASGATFTKKVDFMTVSTGTWVNYLKATS